MRTLALAAASFVLPTSVPADDPMAQVREATAGLQDVAAAVDAGYVQFFGCVHEPLSGSMGIHFVNGGLVADGTVDAATPEAVMYEPRADGTLALVGVEYVVFKADWDAANDAPPELFGQTFNVVDEPNRYGIATFYELHAWAWKANPTGDFADWNPAVICPTTEGHAH
jgi:hypothetical protein